MCIRWGASTLVATIIEGDGRRKLCVCDLFQSQAFLVRVRPLYVTGIVCKMGDDSPEYGHTCIFLHPNGGFSS